MLVYFLNLLPLCLLCAAQLTEISQPLSFQAVKLGDAARIQCYIKSELNKRVWYKLTPGRRLQLVAQFDTLYNRSVISEEFLHYSVKYDNAISYLSTSAAGWEDVGTYFCGVVNLNSVHFGSGTFLMVRGTKTIGDSVSQQPENTSVYAGESVTLNCSVETNHSGAEHTRVTWWKTSDRSAPEMIYSRNIQNTCQRTKDGSGRSSCVYSLTRNLSSEDAGTYICAVTSCGEVLFGKGTRIHIHMETDFIRLSPTLIALTLSNISLGLVTLLLLWTLCRSRRKESTDAGGSAENSQISQAVIYTGIHSPMRSPPARHSAATYSKDSVIYSDIRYSQRNQ